MRLNVVRYGRFSGSGTSLAGALTKTHDVLDSDMQTLTRKPHHLAHRLCAHAEAALSGGVPWHKTSAWASSMQRHLLAGGFDEAPTLFIQTLVPVTAWRSAYVVYTDRVGLEGRARGGAFGSRFSPAWEKREKAFLSGAKRILTMGETTAQSLVEDYDLRPEIVQIVGAGPNSEIVEPQGVAVELSSWLFVGVDWERKGVPDLLTAFEGHRTHFPNVTLTIVGCVPPGPVPEGVEVVGRVPPADIPRWYADASAFVMPSHQDAFTIALVEAMYAGLPSVATDVGSQAFIIGDAGMVIPPGSPTLLLDAMNEVATNYADFAERAHRRNEVVREALSWESVAGAVAEALR